MGSSTITATEYTRDAYATVLGDIRRVVEKHFQQSSASTISWNEAMPTKPWYFQLLADIALRARFLIAG